MASEPRPYAEEWLQFEGMTGGRFTLTGDVPAIRTQFLGLFSNMKAFLPSPTDAVNVIKITLPDSGLEVTVYSPTKKSDKLLPVGLYMHSGGWVAGGVDYEDHLCRYYVEQTPTVLFCPEYRLAPEHVFPAGLDDCFEAYKWMISNAAAYGADPSLAYTIGGSAGGNLAIVVALKVVSTLEITQPVAVLAACTSSIEPSAIPEKYQKDWHPEEFEDSAFLNRACMDTCEVAYGASPTEPLFAILLHPALANLPPTYLVACDKDPTHDEVMMLNAEMKELGCKVDLKLYKGYPHFFFIMPLLKASQEYLEDIVKHIQEMVVAK